MITRLIFVNVPPDKQGEAMADWKKVCAPLMKSQPGCISEELLQSSENPGEYISLSTWKDMASIEAYRKSSAHQQIKHDTRGITAKVQVKTYQTFE